MEPTAPPLYSRQNHLIIQNNSIDRNHPKKGQNLQGSIITSNEYVHLNCKHRDIQSTENRDSFLENVKKDHIRIQEVVLNDNKEDMNTKTDENKSHPYENCHKQLCGLETSLGAAPSYENVARFYEQQRQIASELESNCRFHQKDTQSSSPPSTDSCRQCRTNPLHLASTKIGGKLISNQRI